MKAFVILNPAAGKKTQDSVREALANRFGTSHIQYEVYETRETDRIAEIVRTRLHDGFDLVVAAGGDGTVSDVIDGLVQDPKPLGIIPTGTGNLIARELGIPQDVEGAIAVIASAPRSRTIDAMRISGRVFVLNASVGISASVIGHTTSKNKHRFGRVAYLGAAILKMFALRPRYIVVAVDGLAHEYRAVEAAIMNCGMLARALYPKGPEISIDDGHLDVWILGLRTIRDYPRYVRGVVSGRPIDLARFITAERSVSIRSTVPLPVQADGDIIGTTPVLVELLRDAVTVLVPEPPADFPALDPNGGLEMARHPSDPMRTG
jgi:YegS/Rv2252/BmrU family lipid kinase